MTPWARGAPGPYPHWMLRHLRRRPSAAMLVALLALFVALGGPAEAKRLINGKLLKRGSVTTKAIKDRTLIARDLSRPTIKTLRQTPPGSVTEAELANGAVTPGKLAPGAVGPAAIAGNAIGGGHIADGSLTSRDIARFSGRFSVDLPAVGAHECWSGEPVGLEAEAAGADISRDVVILTAGAQWPDKSLSLTTRQSSMRGRFVLIACNPTNASSDAARVLFNYAVIAVP
jgi:hypothetical protein